MSAARVLTVNAGSSSLKCAVFQDGARIRTAAVAEIGGAARLSDDGAQAPVSADDHSAAFDHAFAALQLPADDLDIVVHRVVHGAGLDAPVRLNRAMRKKVELSADLAPLHNPPASAVIEAIALRAPDLPQVAAFDTAFHAHQFEEARSYALPDLPETRDLKRYGFHGLSYQGLVTRLPQISGRLPERLLALHLGNGASLCAIRAGRSVATTMGYSPLEGLTMGTRSGSLDPNAVLTLAERVGLARAREILNKESGLLGLAGASDMRALAQRDDKAAAFAVSHFCYWALRHAGSMVAAMGGCDAIAFTGGIGEHDATVRAVIMEGLGFLGLTWNQAANADGAQRLHADGSPVAAWIVPADEEATLAEIGLSFLK